jgi:hypothetical protein
MSMLWPSLDFQEKVQVPVFKLSFPEGILYLCRAETIARNMLR